MISTHLGETLALTTAIVWAFAVILFKRSGEAVHPIGLNLFKNVLAALLLLPTMWIAGERLLLPAPTADYLLLLASGALGIGIADTLYFKSLNVLGAGLSAIVVCLYSPFIITLSVLWLGESLTVLQVCGATMIVSAVFVATFERGDSRITRRDILLGILWGATAQAATAVGVVAIKPLLNHSPLLWVTEIRLLGGLLVLLVVLLVHSSRGSIVRSIFARRRWGYTVAGSFTGAYLSMVLWLAGMKYTQASIAAALNQTSNVFIFLFAFLFLREKITVLRVAGIALAVTGAIIVTFG